LGGVKEFLQERLVSNIFTVQFSDHFQHLGSAKRALLDVLLLAKNKGLTRIIDMPAGLLAWFWRYMRMYRKRGKYGLLVFKALSTFCQLDIIIGHRPVLHDKEVQSRHNEISVDV